MAALLIGCLALLGAVLTLNVIVDPFGTEGLHVVPTAVLPDRPLKLALIERLKEAPEIVILGNSRSQNAEPAFLQRLTGHTGFNAGVSAGRAPDAWVMTRVLADRFPRQKPRYLWFIDPDFVSDEIAPELANEPLAKRYLPRGGLFGLRELGTYLTTDATSTSLHVLRKCVLADCRSQRRFLPDGSLPHYPLDYSRAHSEKLAAGAARNVADVRAHPPLALPQKPSVFFERTLAYMNAHGARPVLVLDPVTPVLLAELERYGDPQETALREYLRVLHRRFDFVLVDLHDPRTWDGKAISFENATHVDRINMRRMLRYIVRHSDGVLR